MHLSQDIYIRVSKEKKYEGENKKKTGKIIMKLVILKNVCI